MKTIDTSALSSAEKDLFESFWNQTDHPSYKNKKERLLGVKYGLEDGEALAWYFGDGEDDQEAVENVHAFVEDLLKK